MKKNNLKITGSEFRIWRLAMAAIFIATVIFLLLFDYSRPEPGRVAFPDQTFITVDLARTPAEQARGLAGRASLKSSHGMLFLFDQPNIPTFWMQGMNFSIDIIWLLDGRIVDLDENLSLDKTLYSPMAPVNQVLEVNAGFVKEHGLKIGDQLEISRFK